MSSSKNVCFVLFVVLSYCVSFISSEPDKGLVRHVLQVSYKNCIEECDRSSECVTAKHIRLSALCYLYRKLQNGIEGPGVSIYIKSPNPAEEENGQCKTGNCLTGSCREPRKIPATEIFGNLMSVGSKLLYRCLDGSESAISVCLTNGSWSLDDLNCNCSFPRSLDNHTLRNVQSWTFRKDSDVNITAIPICSDNCSEMQIEVICKIKTGEWIFPETVCCMDINKGMCNQKPKHY